MTSPEDIDDQDEILAAYEAQEQNEWFAAPRSNSDDENEDTTSQHFEEREQDDDHDEYLATYESDDKDEWFDATPHLSED
jgi:hypothetical protein